MEHLEVRDIIVCGHSDCGAMKALYRDRERFAAPPTSAKWLRHGDRTMEVVAANYPELSREDRDEITAEENVLLQMENLRTYPVVHEGGAGRAAPRPRLVLRDRHRDDLPVLPGKGAVRADPGGGGRRGGPELSPRRGESKEGGRDDGEFRVEKDSMGEVRVPAKAYYGAQSQRAVDNFPVSGERMPLPVVHAVALDQGARGGGQRGAGDPPGSPGGGDLPRRPGGPRGEVRRPVRRRRLPDRLRHLDEHERERGAGEPGERAAREAAGRERPGPPERPREPVPVEQRRDPVGDPDRRRGGSCPTGSSRRSPRCGTPSPGRRRSSPTS